MESRKRFFELILVGIVIVAFYSILNNLDSVADALARILNIITPVLTGIIIAYIMNPVVNFVQSKILYKIQSHGLGRRISVAISVVLMLIVIVLPTFLVIRQLVESINKLMMNFDSYTESLSNSIESISNRLESYGIEVDIARLQNPMHEISLLIDNNKDSIIETSVEFGRSLINLFIGLILAIYILVSIDGIKAGAKTLLSLVLNDSKYEKILEFSNNCNKIVTRFILYDFVDAIMVGVSNVVFLAFTGTPYIALISVVAGITNLAPTFGPWAGLVINLALIFLVKPEMALAFLIFTAVLQTLDGYVIKPKLFGNIFEISPIAISIALVLGGRLFGVAGLFIAIPFVAIASYLYHDLVLHRLRENKAKKVIDQVIDQ